MDTTLKNTQMQTSPLVKPVAEQAAYIVVMGPTGAGKSTFINTATRSTQMEASAGLEGYTLNVKVSAPCTINGRTIRFIDTPGFDDTMRGDADILRSIGAYLAALCAENRKMAGVIYLKDISHIRMTGTSRRNLRICQTICGDLSLPNVAIATTMWGRVLEEEGVTRQRKLEEGYFKHMVDKGATVFRHDDTGASTDRIVEHLLSKPPTTLRIQAEIIHEGKELFQTQAGQELLEQLGIRTDEVTSEVTSLRVGMSEIESDDNERRREIEEELEQAETELRYLAEERMSLAQAGMKALVEFLRWQAVPRPLAHAIARTVEAAGLAPAVGIAVVVGCVAVAIVKSLFT